MPQPQNLTEQEYFELKNMLESDDPSLVDLQPRMLKAVQAYESQGQGGGGPGIEETGDIPASLALPEAKAPQQTLPNRTQDPWLEMPVEYTPDLADRERPSPGEMLGKALTLDTGGQQKLWQEPSRQAVIREVARQANSGELWGEPVPFTEQMAAHYFEGQPAELQAQFEAEFADRAWRDEVERAQEQGYSVKRAKFADVGPVEKYGNAANDMMKSAALGFADTASLGLSDEVMPDELRARLDEVRAQNPTSEKLGMIGGVLAPIGAPGLAARGSGALLNVGKGGLASRMARSGGAGAIGAGATQGLESVIAGEDPEQVLEAVGGVLPLGFFGGALGEAAGTGIRRMRDKRLQATKFGKQVVDLEGSGGGNRFLFGPTPSRGSQRSLDQALREGAPEQAADISNRVGAEKLAQAMRGREDDLLALKGRENQAFYATDAARRGSMRPAFQALKEAVVRRTDDAGDLLPFHSNIRQAGSMMGQRLSRRASIVDDAERSRVLQNPNFDVLSPDEARSLGITLDVPPGMSVAVDLGNFTAQQVDDMLGQLDSIMNQASIKGVRDPALNRIAMGMRRTRDTFGQGWADTKARHAQMSRELENDKVRVGLQPDTKIRPEDERVVSPMSRAIGGSTNRGNRETRLAIERNIAGNPEATQAIRDAVGTKAFQDIMNQMEPGQSGGLLVSAMRQGRARVLDPAMKALGQPAMTQIRGLIDSLPSDARDLLSNYISGQFQMTGGALGTKASQALDTTPEMTAEQRQLLRQKGVEPRGPEPEPEGPLTEDEWYKKMFKALVDLAGD